MKRQHAEIGVKYWGNEDLLDLQGEPLKALDGFFAQYGPCIVQGCGITPSGDVFDIDPGLVVLEGKDHRGETVTMIVPFEGVTGTSLPVFLTLEYQARVREYGDGKVKPIAYDYMARASTVQPAEGTAFLRIADDETPRFVDVLGDEKHSFITDVERAVWNAKETPAGAQQKADKALADAKGYADGGDGTTLEAAKADASVKSEAALRNAKSYTDTREGIIRTNYANADASTLRSAKTYADQVVAALVDGSPEALNTLQELAAALGNDPNFATTVMNEIGKRATTEALNTALEGKVNKPVAPSYAISFGTCNLFNNNNAGVLQWQHKVGEEWKNETMWHSGNFNPNNVASIGTVNASSANDPNSIPYDIPNITRAHVPGYEYSTILTMDDTEGRHLQFRMKDYANRFGAWIRGEVTKTWYELYHSGNLTTATTSAAGLMSATDKQKLDRIGDGVTSKCCGRVNSDGGFVGGFGCSSSTRLATGKYRVYHNMGHTNYAVTVTMTQGVPDTYDNTPHVAAVAATYFDVWMGTGPGSLEDTGFYFITMPYQ